MNCCCCVDGLGVSSCAARLSAVVAVVAEEAGGYDGYVEPLKTWAGLSVYVCGWRYWAGVN